MGIESARPDMTNAMKTLPPASQDELRARNRRLGLILATVALVFALGFVVRFVLLGPPAGR